MIAGTILMLAIELQLCLAVTARLDSRKYAREAIVVHRDELNPLARSRGELR